MGVIAQELEKTLPELVLTRDGFKTVAYTQIIGLLVEAAKELTNRMQALEDAPCR